MSLPDLLSSLAALLPERVFWEEKAPDGSIINLYSVRLGHDWKQVWFIKRVIDWHGAYGPWWLEMALREECEARGWTSLTELRPGSARVTVYSPKFNSAMAPTPAEALAAAVIQALRAEKGEE